ncbi:MAG: lysostaphin resistance A-like protein [Rubrobacteraceae bacterium]
MQATLFREVTLGPRFVRQAAIFYGILAVIAATWNGLRNRDFALFGDSFSTSVFFGLVTALATVSLGLLTYRLFPVFERLAEELAPLLVDGATRYSLVLISVFSGIGEEMFFRGVLQEEFGLVVASIIFGLVHVGPDRRYLVWTAWAILAGFLFGFLYETTGGLLAPTLAHVLHNAATLLLWKQSREKKRGTDDPPP